MSTLPTLPNQPTQQNWISFNTFVIDQHRIKASANKGKNFVYFFPDLHSIQEKMEPQSGMGPNWMDTIAKVDSFFGKTDRTSFHFQEEWILPFKEALTSLEDFCKGERVETQVAHLET